MTERRIYSSVVPLQSEASRRFQEAVDLAVLEQMRREMIEWEDTIGRRITGELWWTSRTDNTGLGFALV